MTIKDWLLQAMKKYQGRKSAYDQVKIKNRSSKLSSQRYQSHTNHSVSLFPRLHRLMSRKENRFCLVLAFTQISSSLLLQSSKIQFSPHSKRTLLLFLLYFFITLKVPVIGSQLSTVLKFQQHISPILRKKLSYLSSLRAAASSFDFAKDSFKACKI